MSRRDYNREIIGRLSEIVETYPDFRFGQILFNFVLNYSQSDLGQIHIDDPFYEESKVTIDRINKRLSNLIK